MNVKKNDGSDSNRLKLKREVETSDILVLLMNNSRIFDPFLTERTDNMFTAVSNNTN